MSTMDPFYLELENRFRGSRELIKERAKIYLPFIEPLKKIHNNFEVLDLGCGRGEWLELLKDSNFKAKGISTNEDILVLCRKLQLDVYQADIIEYLKKLPAGSLSVISAFHVIEHISFAELRQLIDEAYRILAPSGILILETPNSDNLVVGASNFYIDPANNRPIPAQLLAFIAEYSGFDRVKTLFLNDPTYLVNTKSVKLIDVLSGASQDYSIVAQKKPTSANIYTLFNEPFGRSYGVSLTFLSQRFDIRMQQSEIKIQQMSDEIRQIKAKAQQVETKAQQIETKAKQVEIKAEQAEIKAEQAEAKAEQTKAALNVIYSSRSWRITAPLRWIGQQTRMIRQYWAKGE